MKFTRFKILLLNSFLLVSLFLYSIHTNALAANYADGADLLVPQPTSDPTNTAVTEEINALKDAQQAATPQESTSIFMNLSPQNPAPGDNVLITLSSYAENLDTSTIEWYVDGKLTISGIGKKNFLIQAPLAGASTTVLAKIILAVTRTERQISTVIRPNVMTVLWQATDSYVPPFYKGKALPTADTFIKVVAMPQIITPRGMISPDNLTYSWQKNYTNIQDSGGFAKNYLTYKNDYLDNSDTIGVSAGSTDQQYSAASSVTIVPTTPSLSFYSEDPNLGIVWDKNIKSPYKLTKDGETIVAAPYFISPHILQTPSLTWQWSMNNVPISASASVKNKIPLKVESGTSGQSNLEVTITNMYEFFERVDGEITIQF